MCRADLRWADGAARRRGREKRNFRTKKHPLAAWILVDKPHTSEFSIDVGKLAAEMFSPERRIMVVGRNH